MAQILNFNQHRPPILPIVLPDGAQTKLHLVPPTVDLQEELRARQQELRALLDPDNEDMVGALYDLAAKLMSCNRNLKTITAEELRTVYEMDVSDLVVFYQAYADYIVSLENAKN